MCMLFVQRTRMEQIIQSALFSFLLIFATQDGEAGWANWQPYPYDQGGPGNVVVIQTRILEHPPRVNVFRRQNDGSIYAKSYSNDFSSEWTMIPGSDGSLFDPAAAFFAHQFFVFTVRMTTWRPKGTRPADTFLFPNRKGIFMTWGMNTEFSNWHSWVEVPNITTADSPAAIAHKGRLYLFVRDLNGKIQFSTYTAASNNTGQWSTWNEVPPGEFIASGSPAVTSAFASGDFSATSDKMYLFARKAADSTIHLTVFNGLCWSGWKQVPGSGEIPGTSAVSPAAVVAPMLGGVHLFVAGIDDRKVYQNTLNDDDATVDWEDSEWSGWSMVPGNRTTSVRLSTSALDINLNLFMLNDTDQVLYMNNLQP
jgi:hypothetical protein